MPTMGKLSEAFPEAASSAGKTPKLRDYNGKTVHIFDAFFATRKVNGTDGEKTVEEPFVKLRDADKVLATGAIVKKCQRLFDLLDAEVKKGDRKALAANIGIPENVNLENRELWRYIETKVTALDRGVKID